MLSVAASTILPSFCGITSDKFIRCYQTISSWNVRFNENWASSKHKVREAEVHGGHQLHSGKAWAGGLSYDSTYRGENQARR